MMKCRRLSRTKGRDLERCEDRTLLTLVFVLNGNAFSAAKPDALTANAAQVLQNAGDRAIQLSTPKISTAAAFYEVARQIESMSHGRPIGLVGFSAGGALAARISGVPGLHVKAVLNDYGPPDLRDYFRFHHGDRFATYIRGHVHFSPSAMRLLSGPSDSSAYVVSAFGLDDDNVNATQSTASFLKDFPLGRVYTYPGPHGVSINASRAALEDFLAHL
jgi:hypothetical protein